MKKVYILEALRTPIGSLSGSLSSFSASDLASIVVKQILSRHPQIQDQVSQLILGNVLSAGLGQAPARQVIIKSGLDKSVSALGVNKVCSSGLMAVILGAQQIQLGLSNVVICGGTESMSNVPYYLPKLRSGAKLGNVEAVDGIIKDGLWDVYNDYHMGMAGELCADKYSLTREMQDEFALSSYDRAISAASSGKFTREIVPVSVAQGKVEKLLTEDEEPTKLVREKVVSLRPVFKKDGTITAANASSLNDGASMLCLCSEEVIKNSNLVPRAEILSYGFHSQEPEWFTTAPIMAVRNAIKNANLEISKIDLFEINEAFSSVALACSKDLGIGSEKVNIRGGAVALGHPIGASGARILTTLLHALEDEKQKHGAVGICNGGGEATAMTISLV